MKRLYKRSLALLLSALLLAGCAPAAGPAGSHQSGPADSQGAGPDTSGSSSSSVPPAPDPEPAPEPDPRQEAIDRVLSAMTTEEKVGQLFFARCPAAGGAELVSQYHLGGYLLFGRDFRDKSAQQVQEDIAAYQAAADVPLLIGVDEEGGTVVRVSSNPQLRAQRFQSPQELYRQGGTEAILADAREKDELLRSLGINVNFAPVADLSTDPDDFIYARTLGRDAEETADYISQVVGQMSADRMGSVLKHFPGYGDNVDTHTGIAVDRRPLELFWEQDLIPFQAGIQAAQEDGMTAVLVSHNIMATLDPDLPASLSPEVHDLLRQGLGFDGVVLTDDLAMDAIDQYAADGSAAVLALLAGNDMVVTTDFTEQIPQVLSALEAGTLTQEVVDQAAARVLGWKYDLGLLA